MKTFKELQESITKALMKFGTKGIRKVQPNVIITDFGKTTSRFNPDIDLRQFNRVSKLKNKYKNVDKYSFGRGQFMKQKMIGVEPCLLYTSDAADE